MIYGTYCQHRQFMSRNFIGEVVRDSPFLSLIFMAFIFSVFGLIGFLLGRKSRLGRNNLKKASRGLIRERASSSRGKISPTRGLTAQINDVEYGCLTRSMSNNHLNVFQPAVLSPTSFRSCPSFRSVLNQRERFRSDHIYKK